jgi:hypothetical protein
LQKFYIFLLKALQHTASSNHILVKILSEAESNKLIIGEVYKNVALLPRLETKAGAKGNSAEQETITKSMILLSGLEELNSPARAAPEIQDQSALFQQLIKETQKVLHDITEFAHKSAGKLISARFDQNSKLNPTDFYRFYNSSMEFLNAGEYLCGHSCYELRKVIASQGNAFVKHFHEEKTKFLIDTLHNDQWNLAEVPVDFQNIVDDLESLVVPPKPVDPVPEQDNSGDLALADARHNSSSADSISSPTDVTQYLVVGGQRYFAVGSTLFLLKLLMDYLECTKSLPTLSAEMAKKILEFLQV